MRALTIAALVFGVAGLTGPAAGQDRKGDPTGTWKWTTERGGQKRETVLKLKVDGSKLTGTISGGGRDKDGKDVKIEDGKFEGGEVTFAVTREFKDQKFTTKYKAKVEGDSLKGTATSE